MPVCLRCKKVGMLEYTGDWILLRPTLFDTPCDIRVEPFVRGTDVSADPIRSNGRLLPYDHNTGQNPYVGLCPACQLSDAQIENMRRD